MFQRDRFQDYDEVVDIITMSEMIYMGKNACYKLLRDKKIKGVRNGKKWLTTKSNIEEFLERVSD